MTLRSIVNCKQLMTLKSAHEKDGRRLLPEDIDIIEQGTVVYDDQKILWVGRHNQLPTQYAKAIAEDGSQFCLTPELVDSHTHLIFGGNRAREYTMRLNGEDYSRIAKEGGGILTTMKGTNLLGPDELFDLAKQRITRISKYGVGTIEVKSGYGLNFKKEKELTLIIDRLKKYFAPSIQIKNTFMAAHAVPKSFKTSKDYMKLVVLPLLDELAPLQIIDAVDIFHEQGYFSTEDTKLLFEKAKTLGIPVKSHADEFFDNKGAILATRYQALSTDHLLRTSQDGIEALANSSTVATLLPGTGLFLGKEQSNARGFLDAGCKVAIASDYNPGSCHCDNLLLLASISAPLLKMNMTEIWAAITLNASHSLGLKNQGAIIPGLSPRFSKFFVHDISEITYSWGFQEGPSTSS